MLPNYKKHFNKYNRRLELNKRRSYCKSTLQYNYDYSNTPNGMTYLLFDKKSKTDSYPIKRGNSFQGYSEIYMRLWNLLTLKKSLHC